MAGLGNAFDRGSLRFQLFRLVVVVAAAALVISLAGGMLFEWNNQQKQLRQSLVAMADAAGVAASAAVAFQDGKAADEALHILAARKEIEAAALYSIDGYRLASYGEEVRLPAEAGRQIEHLPDFSLLLPSATLFQPIRLDGSVIGYIFIRADLRTYRNSFLLHALLAIGVNLLGLALVLGLGRRVLDGVVQPVKALADTSRQVRESKDFSLRAATPDANAAHNEVGELVVSFNAMLAEIEQREQALASYQRGLEGMVLERTEALQAANAKLQAAKDAAEAATVAKSRFLAAASHDLRQPIQAIHLFLNALERTALSQEQKRIADYLALSSQSLGDLLNALLDVSRLDAGATRARPGPVDVHDLVASVDAEFAPIALSRSLRFKLYFPEAGMTLFADHHLMQSLLRNLIGNALKYTERGGVLVAIRRRGGQALIQVWDTGIGIAPEHLESIFDEYFQVANPERDKDKGLGLGLAIVRRLAKLLETEVVCRSRLGRGSVFEFRLPLVHWQPESPEQVADGEPWSEAAAANLAGRRIAVIEDDTAVAKAIQVSLESAGMRATVYTSAEQALADAAVTTADFYVSDYRLPGMNGHELLDAIQQRAAGPIKAVLVTGDTSPGWAGNAATIRWPVLFKPIDLPRLISAIRAQDAGR